MKESERERERDCRLVTMNKIEIEPDLSNSSKRDAINAGRIIGFHDPARVYCTHYYRCPCSTQIKRLKKSLESR